MGTFGLWVVERVVLPVLLAAVRVVAVFSRVCVRFFSVSLFLVLCALVLVKLCLAASRLSVTAFFLMKNVLRHGREKKN